MKSIKNVLKSTLYAILFFLISTLILTILNHFNLINYKITNIIKITILPLSLLFGGYKIGKKTEKNGWLEGLKLSSLISILLIIITLLLNKFKPNYLVYIVILIVSGTLGSMFGIKNQSEK